jgi:hypothetical protein
MAAREKGRLATDSEHESLFGNPQESQIDGVKI